MYQHFKQTQNTTINILKINALYIQYISLIYSHINTCKINIMISH